MMFSQKIFSVHKVLAIVLNVIIFLYSTKDGNHTKRIKNFFWLHGIVNDEFSLFPQILLAVEFFDFT